MLLPSKFELIFASLKNGSFRHVPFGMMCLCAILYSKLLLSTVFETRYPLIFGHIAMCNCASNAATAAKLEWSLAQREAGVPTVPSTIGEELAYNVFMRTDVPGVQHAVGCEGDAVGTMRELRARKDTF